MIGYLRGSVRYRRPPHLLIEVNGVGYEVEAPMSTFYALPEATEVELFTHLAVREDAHTLYGFATEDERRLFRSLIKVNGVGAKMALAILSGTSVEGFVRCVREDNTAALTRLPGIGKKTAERLIVEMRDKLGEAADVTAATLDSQSGPLPASEEAAVALQALGYKPADAQRMIRGVKAEGLGSEELIRRALQGAGR